MNCEKEQWWVFTFGCGQQYAGRYVKFFGTYGVARQKMMDRYGRAWAFQYSEDEWQEVVKRFCLRGLSEWLEKEWKEGGESE